jgi:hypothetical protein
MRKLLLVPVALALTSCTLVEDFGTWQKWGTDRRLEGGWTWIKRGDSDEIPLLLGDQFRVAVNNWAYRLTMSLKGEKLDGSPSEFKTFDAGKYQFFAVRAPSASRGFIERYRIKGNVLELCQVNIADFVTTTYPRAANIKYSDGGDAIIALFDSEVVNIFSRIPDSEASWDCLSAYRRIR